MKHALTISLAVLFALAIPAAGQEQAKESVALTVYNGGYGVVREVRMLDVGEDGKVQFTDVAKRIDPTTVHFKSLTDKDAKLLEQNYQYDLVSAEKLLDKYIDKPLEIVAEGGRYAGTLLSFDGGQLVLRQEDGKIVMIQRADNVRDIRFSALPGGLLTRPTLLWLVAGKAGRHTCEVTYQTGGLGWHAEYVLVLGGDDATADLSGWVSVENRSGKAYKGAHMKFIAGDVRREQPPAPRRVRGREMLMAADARGDAMEEKAFFEYHMYTLPRPTTVADNEIKQLEMFTPVRGFDVEKKFLYGPARNYRWRGGRNTNRSYGVTSDKKVQVFIHFRNDEKNKLGIPLPAGKVRVYKKDPADEALEFIGEQRIDHTPRNEKIELEVGNAFDLVGERRQTNFTVDNNRRMMTETIEIKLRNNKKPGEGPVTIRAKEPMHRSREWRITEKSHDFEKLDAHTIAFDVKVEPDKEEVVTYTVEYRW